MLKYLLHGIREENGKKVKKVSVKVLPDQLRAKIGFEAQDCVLIARYLIEKPGEDGKVESSKSNGKSHEEACTLIRKELHSAFQEAVEDYSLFNGLAITSLLTRIRDMFEEHRIELATELDDADYEETKTAKMADIYRSMKMIGIFSSQLDPDIKEFL